MKIYGAFATAVKNGKYHAQVLTFNAENKRDAQVFAQSTCMTQIFPIQDGWDQHYSGVVEVTDVQINATRKS